MKGNSTKDTNSSESKKEFMPFRNPKEYERMSPNERQELTKSMMGALTGWAGSVQPVFKG